MPKPLVQATGRRKRAVARVRIRDGAGKVTINRRELTDYFPSATHQGHATEALRLAGVAETYDVDATIDGGGVSGQAGALRLGIARGLIELDPELRPQLKKAGMLTRDPREKESKKYGLKKALQGAAVLQALINRSVPTRFGTDGIRGLANIELSPELVLSIGAAAARVLDGAAFLVGRDTRESGPMLAAALSAGVASQGVDVIDLGVITTPGLAFLAASRGLPAAMISASHNPFADNGVKLLSATGSKLGEDTESSIEVELDAILQAGHVARDVAVGSIFPDDEGWREYAGSALSARQHLEEEKVARGM